MKVSTGMAREIPLACLFQVLGWLVLFVLVFRNGVWQNGVKLDKLFQSPLTFWTAIRAKSQKFTNVLSISCRRYLKNYLRGTMGEERFNGLALMHAHRDIALNLDEIIDLLASLHPRRKRMANSLCIDD